MACFFVSMAHSMKPPHDAAIENLELLETLRDFSPVVIGTPPLGIAIDNSDIDIACSEKVTGRFSAFARQAFHGFESLSIRSMICQNSPSTLVSFQACGWDFELFCQTGNTERQWGVRHFRIEQRLLALRPDLRSSVVTLKEQGLKTEPAFATLLRLSGDPYEALLALEKETDQALETLLSERLPEQR